mgnify:CR=1 FL=1
MKVKVTTLDSKAAGDITLADNVFAEFSFAEFCFVDVVFAKKRFRPFSGTETHEGKRRKPSGKPSDQTNRMMSPWMTVLFSVNLRMH